MKNHWRLMISKSADLKEYFCYICLIQRINVLLFVKLFNITIFNTITQSSNISNALFFLTVYFHDRYNSFYSWHLPCPFESTISCQLEFLSHIWFSSHLVYLLNYFMNDGIWYDNLSDFYFTITGIDLIIN